MTQNGATPAQLNALSKPVPPKYIKTDDKGNSYVTARFIMNLLDSTVGKANWKDSYRLIMIGDKAVVECTLSIKVNGEWVGKADVGGPAKTFSPEKSLYSGALKRAAFRWGIARELYGEGNYYVPPDNSGEPLYETLPTPEDGAPAPRDVPRETGVGEDAPALYDPFADDRLFDPAMWSAGMCDLFVEMELAANGFAADKRLRKVLNIHQPDTPLKDESEETLWHDAPWHRVLAAVKTDPLTVAEVAHRFKSRKNMRELEAQEG